jgi:hypothetical protein
VQWAQAAAWAPQSRMVSWSRPVWTGGDAWWMWWSIAWWSGTDVQGGLVPRARQARALPVRFRSGAAVQGVGAYPAEPGPSLRA